MKQIIALYCIIFLCLGCSNNKRSYYENLNHDNYQLLDSLVKSFAKQTIITQVQYQFFLNDRNSIYIDLNDEKSIRFEIPKNLKDISYIRENYNIIKSYDEQSLNTFIKENGLDSNYVLYVINFLITNQYFSIVKEIDYEDVLLFKDTTCGIVKSNIYSENNYKKTLFTKYELVDKNWYYFCYNQ